MSLHIWPADVIRNAIRRVTLARANPLSGWPFLMAVFIVALAAASAVFALRRGVDKHHEIVLLLARVEAQANRLNALEWQAIGEATSGTAISPEILEGMQEARTQIEQAFGEMTRLDPDAEKPYQVSDAYRDYIAAMEDELRLIAMGQIVEARRVDEEQVDPNFKMLSEAIAKTNDVHNAMAQEMSQIADVWSLLTLISAIGIIALLLWRFNRARQIAQLALAEQRILRESEKKYRALVSEINDGFFTTDTSGIFTFANEALAEIYGCKDAEELVGRSFLEFIAPELRDEIVKEFRKDMENGKTPEMRETPIVRKDGSTVFIEVKPVPVFEEDRLTGTRGVVRDITERKRAEERIRRESARSEALARVAARLNAQLDLDAMLEAVCEETAHALGVPAASINLYDEKREVLFHAANFGLPPEYRRRTQPTPRAVYDEYAQRMGAIIVAPDVQIFPGLPNAELYASLNIRTVIVASMLREGQLVGSLNIFTFGEIRHLADEELALLKGLADQAAQAILNAQLFVESQQRAAEMSVLQETALDLASHLEIRSLLETMIRRATDLLGGSGGIIYQWEEPSRQLRCTISHSLSRDYTNVTLRPGEGMAGRVYQTGQPLVVNDYAHWEGRAAHLRDIPSRAVISVPILWQSRVIGVININDESGAHTFDDRDVRLLSLFANQAAIAIENAQLYASVQRELSERKRYEFIVNTSHELMTLINQDRRYEAVNAAYCQAHHKTREAIVGRTVAEVWGEEIYQPNIKPHLDRCLAGHVERYQEWFRFANSELRCFDVTCYPYLGQAGTVTHAVVVSHDITEIKRAGEKLAATATELEQHNREVTLLNEMGDLL
ncbi:MAG: PAS domain S-box protein, partial [Gemmatimonadota bacterium]